MKLPTRPVARTAAHLLVAAAALVLVAGCGGSPEPSFLLGGIQVNENDIEAWLDAIEAAGMNTISVTDYAHQGDWDTDHMWWSDENVGLMTEVRAAKLRGLRVVLILRVALDHAFERNQFLWHGMIMPRDDAMLASWFAQYTAFARHWAAIAEREGVDLLMIGSEMNALASTVPVKEPANLESYFLDPEKQAERREQLLAQRELIEDRHLYLQGRDDFSSLEEYIDHRIAQEAEWAAQQTAGGDAAERAAINRRRGLLDGHWRTLVEDLREVYSGPLGYAANFDQYHQVGFWDALDVIGINAYFELRDRLLAPGEEDLLYDLLAAGWDEVLGEIAALRQARDIGHLPVVFTEIGYTYRANSTLRPWADTGFASVLAADGESDALIVWRDQPFDLGERALALRALHDAHSAREEAFLEGLLFWKLSTKPYHRDVESFLVVLGEEPEDPILTELRHFLD